jgi:hypothetical protein
MAVATETRADLQITVEVDGSKVVLRGSVRSWAERTRSGARGLGRTGPLAREMSHA